ncbi:hypothetical protein CDAR_122641 [Caerostris darwini]|uniref:Uncharacterized protein n=1 Tax=Caerostris darwini TaxID=1538125 RepID=A0AAV4MDH4_9ARAC|nr:hypothetical protein CDAR_122641 [Caerostris darwini]
MVLSVNGLSLPPLTEIAFVRGCVLTNETPIVGMQGRCALNGRSLSGQGPLRGVNWHLEDLPCVKSTRLTDGNEMLNNIIWSRSHVYLCSFINIDCLKEEGIAEDNGLELFSKATGI